jgi:hypothetical protein
MIDFCDFAFLDSNDRFLESMGMDLDENTPVASRMTDKNEMTIKMEMVVVANAVEVSREPGIQSLFRTIPRT